MVNNTGAIRAKEYLDRAELPSEKTFALSKAELGLNISRGLE